MKHIVLWLLVAVAGLAAGCTGTPSKELAVERASDARLADDVARVAEELERADEFSGVVLLSRHGTPLLRRAFGPADRERQRANTVDTPFQLASIGKMFTAVAVGQLVEQERLSLDATVGSLLPDYPAGEGRSQVAVRHLLTMSSGIPDLFRSPEFWAGIDRIKTPSDFWPFFAAAPLNFAPGSKWEYSNSNFLILGAIVERIVGRPFHETVEQQVFRRAGMMHTSYRASLVHNAARGYTRTRPDTVPAARPAADGWYPAWEEPSTDNSTADGSDDFIVGVPMGGGVSTAEDLARFADALMQGRLLGREMTERLITGYVATTDYGGREGYGFETRLANGIRSAGHRGGFPGIANLVEFYPDLGYVLVVLGNTDADGTSAVANQVRTAITAKPGGRQ